MSTPIDSRPARSGRAIPGASALLLMRRAPGLLVSRATGRFVRCATGRLVRCATGRLISRATGRFVRCATGRLVRCATGRLVRCATGRLISRATGRFVSCATGRLVRCATGLLVSCATGLLASCATGPTAPELTREQAQRAALFDSILEKTRAREAFSPIKNQRLGIDFERDMRALRAEIVHAHDDHALLQALVKLSCVRKDRHLRLGPVIGGLTPRRSETHGALPLEFSVDHASDGSRALFVSDLPFGGSWFGGTTPPAIGDTVIGVHAMSFERWSAILTPYLRYSTEAGRWQELARSLRRRNAIWPDEIQPANPTLRLRRADGSEYRLQLAWRDLGDVRWQGIDDPYYEGFSQAWKSETFDVHVYAGEAKVLLLAWHGFGARLVEDIDRLMTMAVEKRWLDYDLILDCTRSRGGSRGAYAVQRLFAKSFRTTFGNLRISDVIPAFVAQKKRQFEARRVRDGNTSETMDDGTWLMDWLEDDVLAAHARGDSFTQNVPFKLAHLPKDADGILQPAKRTFRGRAVCLFGPHGGSHLDQFASIVVDNDLAHTIGMPTGGYSNTWEWTEVLTMPGTERPLCSYMWSIGHTIRPNGEILEGNPADVAEPLPTTRENIRRYYTRMLDRAMAQLGHR